MPSSKIAFFGATGDCAGHCLAYTLNAGYDCIALARTPSKLTKSMKAKGVSNETLDQHLTIVQGDVKDVEAVKNALQLDGQVVDTIVSGIGGTPKLQWSLATPATLDDPELCQKTGRTILQALGELRLTNKQLLINISTTGTWRQGLPRDVPLLLVGLYHWLGHVMHSDKRILEEMLVEHMQSPEGQRSLRGYVNIKPSLLMDGEGYGLEAVRQGVEQSPAIGYTIQRKDVGLWIFERLLKADVKHEWVNNSVTLTY